MFQVSTLVFDLLLFQGPSLDSPSPRERMDAIEQMSKPANETAIPSLAGLLKKEPRSDVRASAVAGLARIGGKETVPVLTETLRSDLDKDVRLQAVESIQRL